MKERPILFSAPMVRALLDDSKTQTRRIANTGLYAIDARVHGEETAARELVALAKNCPYGAAGERLWVRETWYCEHYQVQKGPYLEVPEARELMAYRADGERPYEAEQPVWRPSIHMPRWASRILLEIVSVRVERLNDISEIDVIAEGCPSEILYGRGWYRDLWESLGGAGSWDANPWVWVIEFKRVLP